MTLCLPALLNPAGVDEPLWVSGCSSIETGGKVSPFKKREKHLGSLQVGPAAPLAPVAVLCTCQVTTQCAPTWNPWPTAVKSGFGRRSYHICSVTLRAQQSMASPARVSHHTTSLLGKQYPLGDGSWRMLSKPVPLLSHVRDFGRTQVTSFVNSPLKY